MRRRMWLVLVLFVGMLLLAAGLTEAQEPGAPGQQVTLAESVSNIFTYQGRLLRDGQPVNGNCDFQFQLWDAASAGTQIGTTQTLTNVPVTNGVFTAQLNFGGGRFQGDARWLAIYVRYPAGSGSYQLLSPRQALTAVPYGFSLQPGAEVRTGDIVARINGLHVVAGTPPRLYFYGLYGNGTWGVWGESDSGLGIRGTTNTGTGVHGYASATSGDPVAVYGRAQAPNGRAGEFSNTATSGEAVGLYASSDQGTAIMAAGTGKIKSAAKSYLWISGNALVKNLSSDTTSWDMLANGAAQVKSGGSTGVKYIYYPVTIPSVLYGQPVKLTKLTVYYKCQDGSKNYITATVLNRQTDADSAVTIINDPVDRGSNVAAFYTLNLTSNNVLSADQGGLGLYLSLNFSDNTNYIQIGGIRLELEHQ